MYSKLHGKSFLKAVRSAYRFSHELESRTMDLNDREIIRGRAHCVAGIIEDAFAVYLSQAIPRRYGELTLFIDQPIIINRARQPRYPDLMICREGDDCDYEILYAAELKANTGWQSAQIKNLYPNTLSLARDIKKAKSITAKDYADRRCRYTMKASPFFRFDIVIVAASECLSDELTKMVKDAAEAKDDTTRAMILLRGEVNQWYVSKQSGRVDESAFKLLMKRIGKSIPSDVGL